MEKFGRYFIFGMIIIQSAVFAVFSAPGANEKPKADKLTISIDSVSKRLPPQIAYYIPDRNFNRSFNFNLNRNIPQPPIINMWPPNDPRNETFTNFDVTDLMMSQQRSHRYTAMPKKEIRTFVRDDPEAAYQNFNYQIDFAKIPDKEPDFQRFERLNREREMIKRVKPKKKRPVSINFANTSPNIRSRIKYIKIDHENEFQVSKDKHHLSDSGSEIHSDELENYAPVRSKVYNNDAKLKKSRRKKPHYSMIKLSHPTSSIENESGYVDIDGTDEYSSKHLKHKNCEHSNSDLTEQPENENESGNIDGNSNFDDSEKEVTNKQQKGFSIYLTKIIKLPKPYRSLRMDRSRASHDDFIPTRIMSSVRGEKKILHKPRKIHTPAMRERLSESGGHIVYTEDGYEEKEYDHGVEDKSLEYSTRKRRSTSLKDLKGQELINHLGDLIKNVTDYLNSSEIIPETDKKYPLYYSEDDTIKDSPIRYSEHAKPVVDEIFSSELYESKIENCDDTNEESDLTNPHDNPNGAKKRLGNLGNKLDCLKKKLFGKNPLNNPLFREGEVSQPKPHNINANIMQEAESIQTISEIVHSDVMDNIKYNSFNENQRIFSDFGISDNFAVGTLNTYRATIKPASELNTNEEYTKDYKRRNNLKKSPSRGQKPLTVHNPFTDPVQLPILDISKYIPTPKYSSTESDDIPLQTDFVPIFPPYAADYIKKPSVSLPSSTTATTTATTTPLTTTTSAPHVQDQSKYGLVQGPPSRKIPYHFNYQHTNTHRTQMQNILLFKDRRPVAVVHIVPKTRSGARV